jgi:hypothetical protein
MVAKGEVCEDSGYKYENVEGKTYAELHVDDCLHIEEETNLLEFGGNLFMQKPLDIKLVMIFG